MINGTFAYEMNPCNVKCLAVFVKPFLCIELSLMTVFSRHAYDSTVGNYRYDWCIASTVTCNKTILTLGEHSTTKEMQCLLLGLISKQTTNHTGY